MFPENDGEVLYRGKKKKQDWGRDHRNLDCTHLCPNRISFWACLLSVGLLPEGGGGLREGLLREKGW